ncbi:MAG: hypothetical protein ACRC0X_04905, partial [Brevinema sp.]
AVTVLNKSPSSALLILLEKEFTHVFGEKFSQQRWDEISYQNEYQLYQQINSPVKFFIAAGTYDLMTPFEDALDVALMFEKEDIPYQYLEVPGASHSWGFWTLMLTPAFNYIELLNPE